MLIDWFTVGAQIVNFLVLVWLLKRYLYGRILRAIDARESTIAAQIADASAREAQAMQQLAQYQAKRDHFEQQCEAMLAQARADAEQRHAVMIEDARNRVRTLEERWQEELDRDRRAFLEDLRRRAAMEILAITRRVIADLTSMEVEQCAVQVFLKKIRSLDERAWTHFAGADLSIRSALQISEHQRTEILQTIEDRLGRSVDLRFDQASGMGVGLELSGNGFRISWNSETYFQELEEDLNEALSQKRGAGATAGQAVA
jgi:F-type H+-transporting ATPase subunit b